MIINPTVTQTEFSETEHTFIRLLGENLFERRQVQKNKLLKKFQTVLPEPNYASELLWFARFLPEILTISPNLKNSLSEDVEKVLQEPNLFSLEYRAGIFPFIVSLSMNNYLNDAVEGSMVEWCLDYFSVSDEHQRIRFQDRMVWLEKQLHFTETIPVLQAALDSEISGKYLSFGAITSALTTFSSKDIDKLASLESLGMASKRIGDNIFISNGFIHEYLKGIHGAMITMTAIAIKMSKLGVIESQTELLDTSSLHILLQKRIEESYLAKSEIIISAK